MKLGMFTACLPEQSLEEIAAWAAGTGYQALEVAAWPPGSSRPFTPCHVDVTSAECGKLPEVLQRYGLSVSSLAYYENNLHPDPATRRRIHNHLLRTIDAAAQISCPTVGTFIGRDPAKTINENLREAEQIFAPIAEHAASQGVSIVIENCVMEGWHPDGYPGNLAYSPELWEWAFALGLYLNFDPSHLAWIGIDPVDALRTCVSKVAHVQAKDIEIFPDKRNRYGYFGRAIARGNPWESGWWRYRVPGLGQINWPRIIDVLYEGGFTGVISVEHEDPVWERSPKKVKDGLKIAHRTLSPLIIEEQSQP